MAQQMVNGSHYEGNKTITNRMSYRYAAVGEPFNGKHKKPQDHDALLRRKVHWKLRNGKVEELLNE